MKLVGPNGAKRPADPVEAAHLIANMALGDTAEERVNPTRSRGGENGARARAQVLPSKCRSESAGRAAKPRGAGWQVHQASHQRLPCTIATKVWTTLGARNTSCGNATTTPAHPGHPNTSTAAK